VLDIIDIAQRQGAVASLNLMQAGGRETGGSFSGSRRTSRCSSISGRSGVGADADADADADARESLELRRAVSELTSVLKDIRENDIKAYVVLSELNRKQELFDRSMSKGNRVSG
jgi:hypothetical protein